MTIWDEIFSTRTWGRWPDVDIVRATALASHGLGAGCLTVLEIGCGPGPQVWFLAHEGHRVVGMDLSTTALDQARVRLSEEGLDASLVRADGGRLPFREAAFDLVVDVEAFAHCIDYPIDILWAEAGRVVKRGGLVASITFSTRTSGWEGTESGSGTVARGPLAGTGEMKFTDAAALRGTISTCGLTVERLESRQRTSIDGAEEWAVEELVAVARRP